MINTRGNGGIKAQDPRINTFLPYKSVNDVKEPIVHIFEKYCKNQGRKMFVLGFSLGANKLCHALNKANLNCLNTLTLLS